ncbi:hypothetical protein Fot_50740 [Forsythia ovata]|uniref:Uncharacterized protein n=1 Tax=Forsythia ovata TaxID=205694 RepID=A0ABD1Q1X9_9LAMI
MGKKNRGSSSAVKVGSEKKPKNSAKLSEPVSEDVGTLVSNSLKFPPPLETSAKVFWDGLCQDSPVAVVNCKDKVVDSIPSSALPSKTFSVSGSRTLGESDTESECSPDKNTSSSYSHYAAIGKDDGSSSSLESAKKKSVMGAWS